MYNDAGVNIHLEKIGFGQSDEEIDFNFQVAKALGCVGITTERSEPLAKKLAPFADKHKIWVAFHNHTNNYPVMDKTDPILSYGQYIGFNLDVGHYFAGTKGLSPIPVIEKYHDRILSLHLKDRTADGGNLPWGQGKTPIKEILQLMKKEKWTFPGDIELEYKIPQGSTPWRKWPSAFSIARRRSPIDADTGSFQTRCGLRRALSFHAKRVFTVMNTNSSASQSFNRRQFVAGATSRLPPPRSARARPTPGPAIRSNSASSVAAIAASGLPTSSSRTATTTWSHARLFSRPRGYLRREVRHTRRPALHRFVRLQTHAR